MSTIETYQKIPKNIASEDDLDFAFLRRTGIAYIESMGGELWTDLNDHDPGVTMLEMLAYAITDLGARLDLPIETILASEDDPELRKQFYRAEEILPSCPVNELDYRKLFIDIEGVRNCWMLPAEKILHVDCVNEKLAYEAFGPEILEQTSYSLQGLNCLVVDYEEDAVINTVNTLIMEAYHANRNLCEDLVDIKPVKKQPISVCASMELERDADENVVHAKIIDAIQQYFASDIRRYSLKEMKEKGYRMDEIFEGPLLNNGFIDTAELEEAGLRSEVRLSDIVNLIMDIDGIISITDIQIKCCCGEEGTGSDWLICLDPMCKPVLAPRPESEDPQGECELESVFNYKKDVLPVIYDVTLVNQALAAIETERAAQNALALLDRFPEIPQGDVLDIDETTTIMNDFPETYGIGLYGLPGTVPESRRAQAKQLKGYLLFFDQILATYFSQLGKVKDLFAMDAGNAPTYFTQAIKDVRGFDEIVEDYPQLDDPLLSEKLVEFLDDNIARRNEILNHLLARFAENFSDYAFILKQMFDANVAEEQLVVSKEVFLAEYISLSSRRGKGYNCQGDVWDTENVSGVQHRVARLSGIEDYSRRDLVSLDLDWILGTGPAYFWRISNEGGTIDYMAGRIPTQSKCQMISDSLRAVDLIREMDSAELTTIINNGELVDGYTYGAAEFYSVGSDFKFQILDSSTIIAIGSGQHNNLEDVGFDLVATIDYLQSQEALDRFVLPIPEEGMFLVEHLFLLPSDAAVTAVEDSYADGVSETNLPWPFLPICIDDCDDKCGIDPYSFRASVVIPGTAQRFDNADFRNFLNNLIRREMPSHILPRICFIDPCQLEEFQIRYQAYLDAKKLGDVTEDILNPFLEIFNKLQNIYPGGRLFDCNSTDVSGSIILGRSNIQPLYTHHIMSKKLTTITPTYHAFAKDQLLSHTDLNEVIDYFEDQDRLSRICLSGVGIVCGFKPTFITGSNTLAISQGSGITTDGDLVHFLFDVNGENSIVKEDNVGGPTKITDYLNLTQYRTFTDDNASYPQFDSGLGQIQLYELLPATATGTDIPDINFFDNRTLLIYLDCYSKEPGACTAISCDSQGVEQVRVLRVLLVNDADLDVVNKHDYLFTANDVAQEYLSLNNVGVPRVIVNETNTASATDLADSYEDAVLNSGMLSNLTGSLNIIGAHVEYDTTPLLLGINNALNAASISNTLFQYRYDLFKDLVDSYNELRALFIEHYPTCCPDIYPFPKHLLLGTINSIDLAEELPAEEILEENNTNRHKFYPSPILTHHYSARQHLISVLERMMEMVENYTVATALNADEIRITPSNTGVPLANRAIPFYYDPQYNLESNSRLVRLWDFKRRTLRRYDEILGYNQADESTNPLVAQPLQYNIDPYNFFRIEGHQGLLYQDALERVNQIRDQYALGFDTKTLGISVDASQSINIDDYTCDFVDLQGQLETCKDMQYCLFEFASQLLSGYSIDAADEGFNHNTAELMGRQRIFTFLENTDVAVDVARDTNTTSSSSTSTTETQYSSRTATTSETNTRYAASTTEAETSKTTSTTNTAPAAEMNQAAMELQAELALITPQNLADFDNPIIKNLYAEDDALGFIVLDAFQRYVGTNSENTYQYMEFQIDALTGPGGALENWNNDIKEGNLYLPAKILSSAYAASLLHPDSLAALTPTLIANYQTEIERLCTYIRQYQASYETLRTAQNTSVSNDLYALSELLSGNMASLCCAGDKLQSILDQIDARKLEILAGLELAQFAEEHPGMEHMAGVPKGGTFIMAYTFNESGTGAIQDGTVIADFALPYLCCSDCRPVNFIVPKNVVSLLLSSSVTCIDTTSLEPITINTSVSPVGGTVDLLTPVAGIAIDSANNIVITPSSFDTNQLNVPIEFTVNGQFTNATLTVVEPASVSISASPAIPTAGTDITSYVFYAAGYGTDDEIIWDFGDGNTATGPVVSHTYQLPVTNDKVTIQLTVIPPSGACPATSTTNITFNPVKVTLDQREFCEGDPAYPFTITPVGASPDITGVGVSADQKFFDPSLTPVGGGNYNIFVNGTELTVATVFPKPIVKIVASLDEATRTLILDSTIEHGNPEQMRWSFFDPINPEVELAQPAPVVGVPKITLGYQEIGEPGTRRIIRLTTPPPAGSPCGDATDEITFTVPEQE